MTRWQHALTLSAFLIVQPAAFCKQQHRQASTAAPANKLGTTYKPPGRRVDATPIAVQQAPDAKASVSESDAADQAPAEMLKPDGTEDPHPQPGALYTDSDETG